MKAVVDKSDEADVHWIHMKSWPALIKRLDSVLLGVRITAENQSQWVHPASIDPSPPLDVKWVSRNKTVVPIRDGALYLGCNMYCIQRGYFPRWVVEAGVWDQFVGLVAAKFNHEPVAVRRLFEPYAWDFIVVVLAEGFSESPVVVSGCLVEYRNSLDISKAPYLYIGDLCTRDDYGHRKMATHICNGVYQLAFFINNGVVAQRNVVAGSDENSFLGRGQPVYVALMIRQKDDVLFQKLIHLYSSCKFSHVDVPRSLIYGTSTVYSPYPFLDAEKRLEFDGYECNAMYRAVIDEVAFADDVVEILDPCHEGTVDMHFVFKFHSFPLEGLEFVKQHGLITRNHSVLFGNPKHTPYFSADEAGLFFEDNYCDRDDYAVFVVKARYFDNEGFVNTSLPSNMAVFIGSVSVYKARQSVASARTLGSAFSASFKCLMNPRTTK